MSFLSLHCGEFVRYRGRLRVVQVGVDLGLFFGNLGCGLGHFCFDRDEVLLGRFDFCFLGRSVSDLGAHEEPVVAAARGEGSPIAAALIAGFSSFILSVVAIAGLLRAVGCGDTLVCIFAVRDDLARLKIFPR